MNPIPEMNALLHREVLLHAVLDGASDLIYMKDLDGRYVTINRAAARLLDVTPEDVIGKDDFAIFPHALAEQFAQEDRAVIESGKPMTFQNEIALPEGAVYLHARKSVCRDESGRIIGVVGISRDVTEQVEAAELNRRAEQEIRKANHRLATVLNSITEGLLVLDRDWRYSYINEQGARMLGMRSEDVLGHTVWELFPNARQSKFEREYRRAVETGQSTHFEEFYPQPLNMWLECHCYPSSEGLSVYFRDITERREIETALRESESRFRKLFDSDLMGIHIPDRFGAIHVANDEFLRIVGYSREDLEAGGVRWDTMTPPEYGAVDQAHIAEAAQRGSCTPYEKEYVRKDGTRVPILCGYTLLEGSQDEYIAFIQDMTGQKRAEEALRQAEKLTMASRFAASMAHEINNPLAAVTNSIYLALQDPELSRQTRELLLVGDQELVRVSQVVAQTLRFHRQLTAPVPAHIGDIMDSVFPLFASRLRASGIALQREYFGQERLYCFNSELRHAFASLISNAVDAIPQEGKLRVRIRAGRDWTRPGERGVRIIVADNGCGIPASARKRIFEPFVTTKETTGTGLGLWVTEGIVRKHRGRIALRSSCDSKQHGTVFSLFFPFDGLEPGTAQN